MMTDLASTTPQSLGRDPMVGLRLARVDGFEPAIALGQDELPAYLRRITILFADDATNALPRDAFERLDWREREVALPGGIHDGPGDGVLARMLQACRQRQEVVLGVGHGAHA